MSSKVRAVRGALAAMVVTAFAAGCAAQPGTAAVVDGRTITQGELEQTQSELEAIVPELDVRTTLVALMVGPFFVDAADANGVGVSVEEARTLAEQTATAQGATDAEFGDGAVEVLRFTMAADRLGSLPDGQQAVAEVEEQVFAADVDVSPRYGDLDAETGQLVRDTPSWIVPPSE